MKVFSYEKSGEVDTRPKLSKFETSVEDVISSATDFNPIQLLEDIERLFLVAADPKAGIAVSTEKEGAVYLLAAKQMAMIAETMRLSFELLNDKDK